MKPRTTLTAVLTLALFATTHVSQSSADEPKKPDTPKVADAGTLVVIDGAGKEHKLKTWKFTAGTRQLAWLAPTAPPEKEPADKEKGEKAPPKVKPAPAGREAFVMREDNSTAWENGVLTLIPIERLRSIDYDAEKETITVRVAISAKPEDDLKLTGSTQFRGINKISIDAEVDKGELGVAEVKFTGGIAKGIRGVRFPATKPVVDAKDAPRIAALTYGDKKGKQIANVAELQALYRTNEGEVMSGLLFFKKTIKIDVAKLKKIVPHKDEGTANEPVWGVTLKSGGDEETLTLMTNVQLDGKNAQFEGLIGRVPAGYKQFPVHLLHEIEFDVKKDEGDVKPKADPDK